MRINSIYSSLTHQPLVLLQQDISYAQFLALLSVAEIFMATNLREGMNLTSHDFIHCQDGELASQRYGSLILSEFTGSAAIFQGHEFIINPWDFKQCADTINKALEMTPERKKHNWEYLLKRKSPYTALAWYSSLQDSLMEAHSMQQSRDAYSICPLHIKDLKESYNSYTSPKCRLFFIEDGATFLNSADTKLKCSSNKTINILHTLANDPKNTVYLTSDRSSEQLDSSTSSLPKSLGLIAENGCFVKLAGTSTWHSLVDMTRTQHWHTGIRKVIEYFAERTEGSSIEERRCTITFKFSEATDKDTAIKQASELADQINGARGREDIRVVRDIGAVSIEPLYASKAVAASWILNQSFGSDMQRFIFVAGGARGDEALFRWANRLPLGQDVAPGTVTTLTAGKHATEAKTRLPDGYSLLDALGFLTDETK